MHPSECQPLPHKFRVYVNVFTYSGQLGQMAARYCCGVGPSLSAPNFVEHERVESVLISSSTGYPTDRVRNQIAKVAKDEGYQFLLMIDDDMHPDLAVGQDPNAVQFLPSAINFALAHDGPCVIGAPYCSGPPAQEVVVMCTREYLPGLPDGSGMKIDKYTRYEAAAMTGIKRVSALPTGHMLIDLRCLDVLPPPWFSYEYKDPPYNTQLASSEDIVFSRNLDWLGVPQYCNWDCWAGHVKQFVTGKPLPSPVVDIPKSIYKAWSNGWRPKNDYDGNALPVVQSPAIENRIASLIPTEVPSDA